MEKMKFETPDMAQMNVEKIAALFPNCVTEIKTKDGKLKKAVNFDALKQMLGESVAEGDESYEFTWVGKRDAMVEAAKPIRKTLRPCVEESKNFDTTENLYIEGDNLEALKLLQEGYLGKVKMIYIDPPYNTGNDFIYKDDFRMDSAKYAEESGAVDDEGNRMVQNSDSNGRFHSDWCSMIYSRLLLARNLLTDDGVIFISIDDNEQANLKKICDEVFGEACFVDSIVWNKRIPKNDNKGIGNIHENVLAYVRDALLVRQFTMMKDGLDEVFELLADLKKKNVPIDIAEKELKKFYNKKGFDRGITLYCNLDNNYEPWGKINVSWPNADTFGPRFDVLHPLTKKPTKVPERGWRWNQESFNSKLDYKNVVKRYDGSFVCGEIWFAEDELTQPSSIKYLKDVGKMLLRSIVSLKSDGGMELEKIFDGKSFFSYPKPVSILRLLLGSIEENDCLILDFFSGSATTAHAVMQLNAEDGGRRKFIMVQLPEKCDENSEAAKAGYKTICEIGKERIRRAGDKILAEQQAKEKSASDKTDLFDSASDKPATAKPLDIGFRVLKIDDSNMKDVYYSAGEISQQDLIEQISNVKDGRTDLDLLFGCLVDWGVSLSLPIKTETIENLQVYNVNDGDLVACFANDIPEAAIRQIAAAKPLRAVFRDSSFKSDSAKINVTEIFKTISPNTTVKVI